jgi:CheY-like chemotaxis protein
MAEIIRASGDTLQRLLSDILDVARIEAGQITIEAAPFHVGDMVRSVAALSQLKCDEKGVRLVVEVRPEINCTAAGDLVRVRQVVTNLLSNAVKFTEKGEVRLTVERMATGAVRFMVVDTGVGFDMADKAKVLGRFQQADSSITRRFGGTGLGLAICCDLAIRMGGVLDCESAPGVGSRFWMELPLEPAEVEAVANTDGGAEMGEAALRILLADDHPTNRKVVELMLEGGAADLTCVEDGQQALEMFTRHRFDLILMDMQMPVMDGVTCIREIRRLEQTGQLEATPIIMLTANALPEHVSLAMAAGADLYLAKPFTATALFDTIAAAFPAAPEGLAA